MRLSLRYRLLAPLGLLLLGDLAATGWAAWAAARRAEARIVDQLHAVADTLTEPPTFSLSRRVLEQMRGLSGAEFLLIHADGTQVGTFSVHLPDPPTGTPTDSALGAPARVGTEEYRWLRVPLRPPHPNEGGTLYIFYPESERRTAARVAAIPFLLLGGVGGLAAGAVAVTVGGRAVRRVRELEQRARAIAAGDFRPMPLPRADDEFRDLSQSVNDMAHQLAEFEAALTRAERMRVLGQFAGGLAHQLRNAAAGARLAVQLHRSGCESEDRESLDVALRQLTRIETNLGQFLALGKPPIAVRQPCDLAAVIGQAVSLLGLQARHTETTLTWHPPADPAMVHGEAVSLGHLFGNVIGNAVEAAGPGGYVEVQFAAMTPSRLVVEVSDTGRGPPSAVADRLFDAFVTGKDQGIGLGLAVAKQVTDAHGGQLTWERRDERTVFRIELPGIPTEC